MNETLARWNALAPAAAAQEILPSCGSHAWAEQLVAHRPFPTPESLLEASSHIWLSLPPAAWHEAFNTHPRIGQHHPQVSATASSLASSAQEQSTALSSGDADQAALEHANRLYEEKFHRIFIVRASGRTAPQILTLLRQRLANDPDTELHEAAEQQRQITELRLLRWLEAN